MPDGFQAEFDICDDTVRHGRMDCSVSAFSRSGAECACLAESFVIDTGLIAVVVLDASAYGEGAAVKIRMARAGVRAVLTVNRSVAVTMRLLNRVLHNEVVAETKRPYLSVFLAIVDVEQHVLRYASCGQETALLFTEHGRHSHLAQDSSALGVSAEGAFAEKYVSFAAGNTLVAVTPGIADARPFRSESELFGTRGVCELFRQAKEHADLTAGALIDRTAAFSEGRLDRDAAVLIARFAR